MLVWRDTEKGSEGLEEEKRWKEEEEEVMEKEETVRQTGRRKDRGEQEKLVILSVFIKSYKHLCVSSSGRSGTSSKNPHTAPGYSLLSRYNVI